MKTVGAFEAKNHLSGLLAEVKQGETIAISKHGVKVAYLVPVEVMEPQTNKVVNAMKRLRELRSKCRLGKQFTVNKLKESGRH